MQSPSIVGQTIDASAEVFSVDPEDVVGRSRHRPVVYARHCAVWVVRRRTDFSYPAIGRFFDRDHTTMISACRAVDRTRDPLLREGAQRVLAVVDERCPASGPRRAMLRGVDVNLHDRIVNAFGYHAPSTPEIVAAHERVRDVLARAAHDIVEICPDGEELDEAIKALELAMFHANAGIARTQTLRNP
jgi:hypothetical protein